MLHPKVFNIANSLVFLITNKDIKEIEDNAAIKISEYPKDEYNNFLVGSNSPDGSIQIFNNLDGLSNYINDFENIDEVKSHLN